MIKKIICAIFEDKNIELDIKTVIENNNISSYTRFADELRKKYNEEIELSDIPELYKCLSINDSEKNRKIMKFISRYLNNLNPYEYVYLDDIFRERTSLEWVRDWKEVEPSLFLNDSMTEKDKILFLGISSFHPNGYYREKALKELLNYSSGEELPFFIIRANDWVEKIRKIAREKIFESFKIGNINAITKCITVFYKICDRKRSNNRDIIEALEKLFDMTENNELKNGLENKDSKIRKFCYKYLLKHKADIEEFIEYIKKEKEPYLRNFVYHEILNTYDRDNIKKCVEYISRDKYYRIRIDWIYYISNNNLEEYHEKLKESLLDKNSEIRSMARKAISKNENIDFRKFYISKLNTDTHLAICGIGDVGSNEDCKLLEKYLENSNDRIIKAVLKSLSILDYDNYKNTFLRYLQRREIPIRNHAKKIVESKISEYDAEELFQIYSESSEILIKKEIAILLMKTNKWRAIIYILEFLDSENKEIKDIAKKMFFMWKENYFRSFIKPSKNELEKIDEKIFNLKGLEDSEKKWLEYVLR